MENVYKSIFNSFAPRSSRYVLKGASFYQYDSLVRMIRSSKRSDLKNQLDSLTKSEAGDLVNLNNKHGTTLLMDAVYYTNSATVSILLEYGADIKSKDNWGKNAFFYLFSLQNHNQIDILKVLVAKNTENIYDEDKWKNSFLHQVIKTNRIDIIQLLIDRDVDLHKKDIDGSSLLQRAVDYQRLEMVRLLLKVEKEINYSEPILGWTALHIAAIHGEIKMIKLLVSKGADETKADLQLKTPDMYAKEIFCNDATKFLTKKETNTNKS